MDYKDIKVSRDGTYFLFDDKPVFTKKFISALKFHPPGLAPVLDESGAYHIMDNGEPAYDQRFNRTFGYYFNKSAVISKEGWLHIHPDGSEVYPERYSWAGNYQEDFCTIRDKNNLYFHIDAQGYPLYSEKYLYAGDFKDGIAVVRKNNNLCTHIDTNGSFLHEKEFIDLDVYHKSFSRARDKDGWFHIDLEGNPIYDEKFSMIEPFYNGFAYVEKKNGTKGIIDESGNLIHTISKP